MLEKKVKTFTEQSTKHKFINAKSFQKTLKTRSGDQEWFSFYSFEFPWVWSYRDCDLNSSIYLRKFANTLK